MHPVWFSEPWWKKVVIAVAAQVLATAVVVLLLTPVFGSSLSQIATSFLYGFAHAMCIGTLAWLVMPHVGEYAGHQPPWIRWMVLASALIGLAAAGTLGANALLAGLGVFAWRVFWRQFLFGFRVAFVISLVCGVAGYFLFSLKYRLYQKQVDEERQRKLATEARLSSLESRLHPHFLFNTLNSISALIPEDPVAAERMTERLAAVLRFSLDSTDRRTVALEHEIKFVSDYLEIQKTRFGPRLLFAIDVPHALRPAAVPPFSLQTLVENSAKYGGPEIRVRARNGQGRLVMEVWDSGEGFTLSALKPGHGLDNLRARLAALWGNEAELTMEREESGSVVRISIPWQETQ